MRAKFLQTVQGSINGINSVTFEKDAVYSVDGNQLSEYLFKAWLAKGVLEIFDEKAFANKVENKMIISAPENKAILSAPENKSVFEEVSEEELVEEFVNEETEEVKPKKRGRPKK